MTDWWRTVSINFKLPTESCAKCRGFKPCIKEIEIIDDRGFPLIKRIKTCEHAPFCAGILEHNGVRVGE